MESQLVRLSRQEARRGSTPLRPMTASRPALSSTATISSPAWASTLAAPPSPCFFAPGSGTGWAVGPGSVWTHRHCPPPRFPPPGLPPRKRPHPPHASPRSPPRSPRPLAEAESSARRRGRVGAETGGRCRTFNQKEKGEAGSAAHRRASKTLQRHQLHARCHCQLRGGPSG